MFKRVLTPLDGSKFAEAALPLAATVAKRANAALELVSAHDPLPPPSASGSEGAALAVPVQADSLGAVPVTAGEVGESLREKRTTYLHDVAGLLRKHLTVDPEVALLEGRADRAIMDRVTSEGADLVVMATHGRGPMERAWLGSIADRLVRQLPVPVLLARPVPGEDPDLSKLAVLRRVLVALDGSALAEAVVEPAAWLARALDVPVMLLRAISRGMDIQSTYLPHAAAEYQKLIEADRQEATEYLETVAGRLSELGVTVSERVVQEGAAPRIILETADPEGGDVVAMATHGRGGLRRLVLGSVSDKVVRAALGPVMLVRPTEET